MPEAQTHAARLRTRLDGLALVYGLILLAVLAAVAVLASNRWINRDEIESLHTAWKIAQGERIYVDFFQHHHPLFYEMLAPFAARVGEDARALLTARAVMFPLFAAVLALTFVLGRMLYDARTALLAVVLLASAVIFVDRAIEPRPDVPQTLAGLLGLVLVFRYLETGERRALAAGAAASALAFLFLQKAAFLIALVGLVLLARAAQRRLPFRDVLLFGGVVALVVLAYGLWLAWTTDLAAFWRANYALNLAKTDVNVPTETLRNEPEVFRTPIRSFGENALLWSFFVVGLVVSGKTRRQRELAALALGLVLWVVAFNKFFYQYYMQAMPLVAITAAAAFERLLGGHKRESAIIVGMSVLYVFTLFENSLRGEGSNTEQIKKIDYVLSVTEPGDHVYDGQNTFNLFRPDIDYFWYPDRRSNMLPAYAALTGYVYDPYARVALLRPEVLSTYALDRPDDPRIARHYRRSEAYPDLLIRRD